MMQVPRCGVRDDVDPDYSYSVSIHRLRKKRFAMHGSKWAKRVLTYTVTQYSRHMPKDEIDQALDEAFNEWQKHADIKFRRVKRKNADIVITFTTYDHEDGDPFDGPGRALAHAFFPKYGGDAHFDDSEKWSITDRKKKNVVQVALHELGHSLGIQHSENIEAIMAPFYR